MPDTLPVRPAADTPALSRAVEASAANHEAAYRAGWNAALAALDEQLRGMRYDSGGSSSPMVVAIAVAGFGVAICDVGLAVRALAKEAPDAQP